jgi:hypothetical protein
MSTTTQQTVHLEFHEDGYGLFAFALKSGDEKLGVMAGFRSLAHAEKGFTDLGAALAPDRVVALIGESKVYRENGRIETHSEADYQEEAKAVFGPGEAPEHESVLIEWDGGWATAEDVDSAEKWIADRLAVWDAKGNPGRRSDFITSRRFPDQAIDGGSAPVVGQRVRLRQVVQRYPHFSAEDGRHGVVTQVDYEGGISVKMDDLLPGAEPWDNEIVWQGDQHSDFFLDCEIIE